MPTVHLQTDWCRSEVFIRATTIVAYGSQMLLLILT